MTIDDILAELKDAGAQLDAAFMLDDAAGQSRIAQQAAATKASADAAAALAAHQAANAKAASIISDVQAYFQQTPTPAVPVAVAPAPPPAA